MIINGQLTGKEPGFFVKNDFTIDSRTVKEDSLRTDSLRIYYMGLINDPIFGEAKANIFCQLSLNQVGQTLNSTNTLDSVILTIKLADTGYFYGNSNSPLSLDVFEVSEDLGSFTRHYSNEVIGYNPTPIGSFNGIPNYFDSITVRNLESTKRIAPSIRIKMESDFANKLFNASSSDLSSNENFKSFLKGLAIVPKNNGLAPGQGGIYGIDMNHVTTDLTLYYDNTKQAVFSILNENSEIFCTYGASNVPAEITKQYNNSGNYDTGYIQGVGQAKVHLTFPDLFDILDEGDVNINQAKLTVKVLPNTIASNFPANEALYIAQPNPETNRNALILDYSYYLAKETGEYNASDNSYTFIITRHLQDILLSKRNYDSDENRGVFLLNFANAFRSTAIGGVLDPLKQARVVLDTRPEAIKLEVLYSKIK